MAIISLIAAVILAACGRTPATPRSAEPSAPVTPAPPAPTPPTHLLYAELLTLGNASCQEPEGASLQCDAAAGEWHLAVAVTADTFARWSLRLPDVRRPLTGNEVLRIDARREGDLRPNLYFVEQDGRRTAVNLSRFGLSNQDDALHIPLREVWDEDGRRPDYAQLAEIQIVFEWGDMSGDLWLKQFQFQPTWYDQTPLPPIPPGVRVPPGFAIDVVAAGLRNPTQLEFVDARYLLVSEQAGRVWRYGDGDGDGRFEGRRLYDSGYTELVGLLYDPVDGGVWLGGRGQLWRTLDADENHVVDVRELRLDGLPWGRHQNNGLTWNPVADPFTGEPAFSWLYFGLGSTEDLEDGGDRNSTILRFPRNGQGTEDLQVVSRGNRNAYDVVWAPIPAQDGTTTWSLFASENGPDFNDAPDEVNHIRWGHHYGFPQQFGPVEPADADSVPYAGPVYPVAAHASADGLAYITNPAWPPAYRTLYVALYGEVFSEERVGHTVDRVQLKPVEVATGSTYRGEADVFVDGLDRPLALTVSPGGDLHIADYSTGNVYRVRYTGHE